MGAVKKFAYDKTVWSPAGGHWPNPSKWRSNTAIIMGGMFTVVGLVWSFSASREWRTIPPRRWIPSMMWSSQFKDPEWKPATRYN